jgi:hypothetical protein
LVQEIARASTESNRSQHGKVAGFEEEIIEVKQNGHHGL